MKKTFSELKKINVNEHVEKKGNLSYLSWAWAVDRLLENDPEATWEFPEPKYFGDTVMVSCNVTAFGKTMRMQLPVMDNRNNAISKPDARKISDATMRCLAKCIACFGIGLYIYAGEDLPDGEEKPQVNGKKSIVADGNHRSGNKIIDKAVDEALIFIRDTVDLESAKKVGRHQWKLCKDNGAHPDQLEIIQQQVENHCQFLEAKGLQA